MEHLTTYISKQQGLRTHIADLEKKFRSKGRNDVLDHVKREKVSELLAEKLYIKKLSAQVDVAIHAYGILIALSKILEDDEEIEYLSLGAGTGGRPFDVETTKRVAEFKFAKWDGGSNTIRQNGIFKDFLELALHDSGKAKYLYCLSAVEIIKFLSSSERNLESVLSRNPIHKKYPDIAEQYETVKAFYQAKKDEVKIVELSEYVECEVLLQNEKNMTNMTKVYPIILTPSRTGYVVTVPDLNINTQGEDLAEAIFMARDAIGLWGICEQDDGREIPEPSTVEPEHEKNELVSWVDIDFDKYRKANDMSTMRINVSVPKYLKVLGDEAGVNFSQALQEKLKEKLHA